MKLFFPNGEHPSLDLVDGVVVVGSSPTCQIVLNAPGVVPRHCEVRTQDGQSTVAALAMSAPTTLNGKPLTDPVAIKGGDLLTIANVPCRVVAMERKLAPAAPAPSPARTAAPRNLPKAAAADDGRTRVRMALPKFVLRGVSGATFGKVFPVHGSMTVGRGSDCDIQINSEEVSRHHARLQLVPAGVMVEDTGSANGTYVNDQRVAGATLLKPGGELRMDVVRFLLIAPGQETQQIPAAARAPEQLRKRPANSIGLLIGGLLIIVLAAAAFVAFNAGWFG